MNENKMEIPVKTSHGKYWNENGRGDGQGDMQYGDHQSYR